MNQAIDLSVVVPCFNEEHNIFELTRRVLNVFDRGSLKGELVLVDDGSADGTRAEIARMEAAHPGVVVGLAHERNQGMARAWRTGVEAARAPLVAVIDADLQYQPEDLLRLHRALIEHSVDIVQGWRSSVGRQRDHRYVLSRGLNAMLNGTFGMNLHDNKSGFVLCAREVMLDLLTYKGSYKYWQSFVMVAAHAKGYSYREVETLFENRRAGKSFLDGKTFTAVAYSMSDLAKAAWEYRVRRGSLDPADAILRRYPVKDRTRKRSLKSTAHFKAYMAAFDQLHWTITRNVETQFESLQKTQWLSRSQLQELRDEKLRRLIRHAYRDVPFYRQRMREKGLRPESIRGEADLYKLPFLTKADVREHLYFDILSESHDKRQVLKIQTSGSTGEPFVCYADRAQLEFRWAATLRSQEWTGYEFGDPCVRLWHQTLGMTSGQATREVLDAAFVRRKFIPIFEATEERLGAMVRDIAEWQPTLIDGYAEALDFLARHVERHGRSGLSPKAIMTSAQTLPDSSRRVIEEAFGCKVFDKYGSREFSGIAYECEAHQGHHVVGEGYIVEILRNGMPARPGELGEVVITDLNNYCLPFVRYRIGDLAVAMPDDFECPCGRGLPSIGRVEGRVQSIIRGTDGRWVPGTFFAHYLKEFDHAIARFQVVQERIGAIRFRVVKAGRYSEETLGEILSTFRKHLGEDLHIEVDFVSNVEMVRTGKRLAAVSHIATDFQVLESAGNGFGG